MGVIGHIKKTDKILSKLKSTRIIATGFATVIIIGSLLLWLPISSTNGRSVNYIDALFTATSATCVTGLVTKVTLTQWSFFGHLIILGLIQIGGIGVVSLVVIVAILMGRKISIKSRTIIQQSFNMDSIGGMVRFIMRVVKGTLIIEAIGAVIYCITFIPKFGFLRGIWVSIFTSISAFCNAGIDIISDDSLNQYVGNPLININTMCLIIIGGLGFPVWHDILRVLKEQKEKKWKLSIPKLLSKLHLHAKLVLYVTTVLIFVSALFILILEWNNAFRNLDLHSKILAALFQSVTFRTAGFQTVDQSSLSNSTVMLGELLMIIGGSPAGCAGGMKTTTFAMLVLVAFSAIREKRNPQIFHRRISVGNIKTGITVFVSYVLLWFLMTILFFATEPSVSFVDGIFETMSAMGTVGLTRGITPFLSIPGKMIIMVLMFLGRTGPITVAMALSSSAQESKLVDLPEEQVMIG